MRCGGGVEVCGGGVVVCGGGVVECGGVWWWWGCARGAEFAASGQQGGKATGYPRFMGREPKKQGSGRDKNLPSVFGDGAEC